MAAISVTSMATSALPSAAHTVTSTSTSIATYTAASPASPAAAAISALSFGATALSTVLPATASASLAPAVPPTAPVRIAISMPPVPPMLMPMNSRLPSTPLLPDHAAISCPPTAISPPRLVKDVNEEQVEQSHEESGDEGHAAASEKQKPPPSQAFADTPRHADSSGCTPHATRYCPCVPPPPQLETTTQPWPRHDDKNNSRAQRL
ncbi:hypothetical protein F5148DRAFT_636252 [Russula earlei]|uniref:Uncharacterized protein n=1 Tax=Russula earlei TaxID=71964 RepID=A0ACC0UG94_9AGAM|nr:hypothetical protein F5148DRAFT_636252 [Russula earlei]